MENLDSEEQLYLALHAMENGQHDIAIRYLKEIGEGPCYVRARYLLAAEYAQIGLYDRAKAGMELVIELDPSLTIASLQKALLHIKLGEAEAARSALVPLCNLDDSDPLLWFGKGLEALLDSEIETAIDDLEKGMALNTQNAALNGDMQKIVAKLHGRSSTSDEASSENRPTDKDSASDATKKFLLSNYDSH